MALIGSIANWGEIQGQINDANGVLTGVISSAELVGGQIVGMRGLKGDKGDTGDTGATGADGQDGFSPSASVTKVGDTATITITDKDGTTTAEVHDGHDGNVFIVELGETTYQEVVDAADDGAIVLLHVENISIGEKQYYPLVQIYNHRCVFVCQRGAEIYFYLLNDNNSWDSQTYTFITTETDPTVPSWAKQATKPTYTASEVGAQETLVSGTNIKTINNTSLLGSGNINIQGGGASAFIAEYGVTTYADVKDAYDEDAIIICTVDDSGNTVICHLAYYDDENDVFYFAQPQSDGFYLAIIASDDTWDDSYFTFASTDTATQLRNGLMDALDKQKLDGIASGAEVNVQSDWNEADSADDAYIKNKPTIPTVAGLLDVFYPVGSYYETSDSTFDPNIAWGGTWELEIAGQVHVSAHPALVIGEGTYHINGALTNTSDGGEATHILTPSETAIRQHAHNIDANDVDAFMLTVPRNQDGVSRRTIKQGTGSNLTNNYYGENAITRRAATGDTTTSNGSAHNNMQPYVVVNRWHRTA